MPGLITDPSQLLDPATGPVVDPYAPTSDPDGRQDPNAFAASLAPLTSPTAPQLAGTSSSAGGNISSSHQGIPGGAKRVGDLFDQAHDKAAGDAAPFNAEYDRELQDSKANYGKLSAATDEQARITAEYHAQDADIYKRQADVYAKSAELEKAAYDHAKLDRAKYMASYQEQLAGVRQLMQQSGDPLGSLTFTQKSGLGFAQFAQGFLAARGINIDVNGQIDRWVNRSIAEHQQQIGNARDMANDQMHLYEIARQTSQDDSEARMRYRGMVIEGLKGSIAANAARFNSSIAKANADAATARLDIEASANAANIGERRQAMTHGYDMLRIGEAKDKAQLEIQRDQNAIGWKNAATERMKAEAKASTTKPSGVLKVADPGATIRDPKTGKVTGVKNMWAIDPNAAPAEQTAAAKIANEQGNSYAVIKGELGKLRELRAPAMEGYAARFGPKIAKEHFDADYRAYERQKTLAIQEARLAIAGVNLNATEAKEWDALLANDSGWQSGSNAQAVEQLEKHYRDKYLNTMNQTVGLVPLAEGDQDVRTYNDAPNDTDANYHARMNKEVASTKLVAGETAEAAQDRSNRRAGVPAMSPSEDVHKEVWASHMRNIAEAAIDPSRLLTEHKLDESPEQVVHDAREQLEGLAKDDTIPEVRREYAKFLLSRLNEDPEALHDDLLNPDAFSTPERFRGNYGFRPNGYKE